jgi:hypothetical protein
MPDDLIDKINIGILKALQQKSQNQRIAEFMKDREKEVCKNEFSYYSPIVTLDQVYGIFLILIISAFILALIPLFKKLLERYFPSLINFYFYYLPRNKRDKKIARKIMLYFELYIQSIEAYLSIFYF